MGKIGRREQTNRNGAPYRGGMAKDEKEELNNPQHSLRVVEHLSRNLEARTTWAVAATVFARLGFVNTDVTARQRLVIHFFDSLTRFVVVRHFYETKTFRTASFPVSDYSSPGDFTERTESLVQIVRGYAVGQISDIDIHKKVSLEVSGLSSIHNWITSSTTLST